MIDPGYIRAALQKLQVTDRERRVFGANGHDYALNPPLPEATLDAFERDAAITLPDDYRTFMTRVGNGGAGPYYGLFPFGQQDDGHGFCAWKDGYLLGDVVQEFPHSDPWNLPASFWDDSPSPPEDMPDSGADKLWEAWDAKLEREYWSPALVNGGIPICHLGCAKRQWLVVSGPLKGHVWCDDRADNGGLYPATDAHGTRHTFTTWYMAWLEDALGK